MPVKGRTICSKYTTEFNVKNTNTLYNETFYDDELKL